MPPGRPGARFVERLDAAVRAGRRLLLHPRHAASLGKGLDRLARAGAVEVLAPWTHPSTGRPTAISNERLARLAGDLLPVAVEGDPIQYQVNRNRWGWVVQLVHNGGVVKKPDQPAVVDPKAVARVTLRLRIPISSATEWRTGRPLPADRPLTIEVPPGQPRPPMRRPGPPSEASQKVRGTWRFSFVKAAGWASQGRALSIQMPPT